MSSINDISGMLSIDNIYKMLSIGDMWVRTSADLGMLVRARRRELGLSQAELTERVGTSLQWIIKLERGGAGVGVGLVLRTIENLSLSLHLEPRELTDDPRATTELDLDAVLARARGNR